MSLEEKFNAAVNVIRSLPKSGSYQPSNELMLRFYSYFKQATEGPCDKPKPGFWDVVNRAKWESWNKLGTMSKDEAMQSYVNELHKIVETMSYSSDVASFLSAGDEFPSADLQLVAGELLSKPSHSSEGSTTDSVSSTPVPRARHDSEEVFIDTVEENFHEAPVSQQQSVQTQRLSNGHAYQITSQLTHLKVLEQLPGTLARLEADVAALRKAVEGDKRMMSTRGWRWPWQELSTSTLLFVVLWPFVAHRLLSRRARNT